MIERLKQLAVGALGFVLLLALYLSYLWVAQRYTEFIVMRTVVIAIACGNPPEAAKLGIACPAPPAAPPAPPGNTAPASPPKPGS